MIGVRSGSVQSKEVRFRAVSFNVSEHYLKMRPCDLVLKQANLPATFIHSCILQSWFHSQLPKTMPRGLLPCVERGRYNRITFEMKQRLVEAFQAGDDYYTAARTLGIKMQTARSIILRHCNGQSLEDQRGGRREDSVKVTEAVAALLVTMVEEKADITLKCIKEKLAAREPPIHLSISSIARGLNLQLITTKNLRHCPHQRNEPRIKADRAAYADRYLNNHGNLAMIYVDETCYNLFTARTRGRAPRGQPAVRQLQFERGPNLNLVMAVSPRVGVIYYELQR